jgi:DNA-binding LacI/PurR family transcriptional regulator
VIALAWLQSFGEAGLRVPADVAVVGYDDVPLASLATPALSTVRQDLHRGAEELVQRLFALIDGQPCDSLEMPTVLVPRASTASMATGLAG